MHRVSPSFLKLVRMGAKMSGPPEVTATIQARRAQGRAQGIGQYESHEPTQAAYRWLLSLVMEDGTEHCLYEYFEAECHWGIIPRPAAYGYGTMQQEDCPTGDCQVEQDVDDESGERLGPLYLLPCDLCTVTLAFWRSWFVTALLAVTGEFAATEDIDWPQRREDASRKVARGTTGKYDEIRVKHNYYLVSFDASIRYRHHQPAPTLEDEDTHAAQQAGTRGSWVEAAQQVDPDSVVYALESFGATERRLDPARNPRWKEKRTVPVRGHQRRVPMRVATLRRKITRVVRCNFPSESMRWCIGVALDQGVERSKL